jgi:hypothetical protein
MGDVFVRNDGAFVRTNAPSLRMNAPFVRTNAPSLRTNAPSLRTNAPSIRTNAPSIRTNAPSLRMNAPSLRMNAASLRSDGASLRTYTPPPAGGGGFEGMKGGALRTRDRHARGGVGGGAGSVHGRPSPTPCSSVNSASCSRSLGTAHANRGTCSTSSGWFLTSCYVGRGSIHLHSTRWQCGKRTLNRCDAFLPNSIATGT